MRVAPLAVAIVLAVLPAPVRADCANPGGSEGYDQCQKYPGCECRSEVKSCEKGGWYTRYYVVEPCAAMTPPAPPPRPPSRRLPPKRKKECEMMDRWLADQQKVLDAFLDDQLLQTGIDKGWRPTEYSDAIWLASHPGATPEPGGNDLMWTRPSDCQIRNRKPGCRWLISQGLPPAACDFALAHERVHERQCRGTLHDPSYSSKDLRVYRDREVEAYRKSMSEIQKWIDANCK